MPSISASPNVSFSASANFSAFSRIALRFSSIWLSLDEREADGQHLRADRVAERMWRRARQLAPHGLAQIRHHLEQLRNLPLHESARTTHRVALELGHVTLSIRLAELLTGAWRGRHEALLLPLPTPSGNQPAGVSSSAGSHVSAARDAGRLGPSTGRHPRSPAAARAAHQRGPLGRCRPAK
ncbi:hypothetical protein [Burkholderia ubonensis]|uniref:hypothetical protein n=1 Tax=Burkholderia ubonensis TaxID=101571 RepID=UPI0012F9481B|nr:hypothetical protein [Burkholderia ubonensis]